MGIGLTTKGEKDGVFTLGASLVRLCGNEINSFHTQTIQWGHYKTVCLMRKDYSYWKMEMTMKMIIIDTPKEIPSEAKIAGKLDCSCNHCKRKTFHYLYETGTRSFTRCLLCGEIWEVQLVTDCKKA
mgnify:CR=1 FL=1